MKKILIFLVVLIFPFLTFSQQMHCKIKIIDNNLRSDSVFIGKNYSATNGIDESFGEVNIFGTPFSSPDIRSIQRVEENHECLTASLNGNDGEPFYFPENVDLKIDFRSSEIRQPATSCFEIKFYAEEYPIKIIVDISDYPWSMENLYWFGLFDNECNLFEIIDPYAPNIDTIVIQSSDYADRVILKKDTEVGIQSINNSNFLMYPSPTNGIINFEFKSDNVQKLSIFDVTGKLVYVKTEIQQKETFNLLNYENGIYIISIQTDTEIFTSKIILVKN